ncbi:MAG: peptidylprolyl isomerase [Candidatus Paceibacterota bacterium]
MNTKIYIFIFVFIVITIIAIIGFQKSNVITTDQSSNQQSTMTTATLKTTKGDITVEFYPDLAPHTVANFQNLAGEGFYNGVTFHRVIEGFMIQGGDPTGTGSGGPGYTFADEFDPTHEAAERGYVRGTLAMANSGPDTNGSQFFIVHQDASLLYQYTIFGRVTSGLDVVDAIAAVETNERDKPLEDVVIEEVVLE